MNRNLGPEIWDTIAALGFDVYASADPRWQSYLIFADGNRIGYLEHGHFGGLRLSTVHVPNLTTGTGFSLTNDGDSIALTREELERAFMTAPHWASERDRESVRKWPSVEAYLKNARLELVRKAG